jgi:hypothetical protein
LIVLTIAVLSACGPVKAAAPAASPSAPQATSANLREPSASPSVAELSCRLPLSDYDWQNQTLTDGFVSFPTATFGVDPTGAFQSQASDGHLNKSVVRPYLYGGPGEATYTRRYGRWLPSSVAAVSPDSSHYAYAEQYNDASGPRSRIHVVDVASGSDRVVYDQGFYGVIDYEFEGLYLFAVGYADAPSSGLWRLDPRTGSVQAILATQAGSRIPTVNYVGGGAAWFSDLAPGDQVPATVQGMAQAFFFDRLMRVDLKTGSITPWFRQPGKEVQAIGEDGQGHAIVRVSSTLDGATTTSEQLWLVTGQGVGKQLYGGPGSSSQDFVDFGTPLADDHGIWFGSNKGVYLYTSDGLIKKASAVGQVAGRCS